MDNLKTIDALNTLVQINNDRLEGYETAAKETEEQDLKDFFNKMAQTSIRFNQELSDEVTRIGGTPTESTKITGKFFRVWMDVKAALSGKDRETILNSCEYGEDVAVETYEEVLKDESEYLDIAQQLMIREQLSKLKTDHDVVKSLRDVAVNAD